MGSEASRWTKKTGSRKKRVTVIRQRARSHRTFEYTIAEFPSVSVSKSV